MSTTPPLPEGLSVFIVDDDPQVRSSLTVLLESFGFRAEAFGSAKDLLLADGLRSCGCLVVDVRMPDMDGLELQQELMRRRIEVPIVIVTGHGDVPLAVRAMRQGAIEFLEKPYDEQALLAAVRRGLAQASASAGERELRSEALKRLATLTDRERDVYDLLITGHLNKIIAYKLQISPRTVEIHRAHVMDKMQAKSVAELIRLSIAVEQA